MREADLSGAGVVVTAAGAGIGAALADAFAARGARLVVNDLDAGAAARTAARVGGVALPGDMADPAGPGALVRAAAAELGRIDLFCANAGMGAEGVGEAPDDAWERSWQLNVMSAVRTVRELLPAWRADGRGHLLVTVSAAGLLTMLGSAPYAATKHAALAFAESLAVEYGDDGVTVQALCPQGVATAMLESTSGPGRALLHRDVRTPEEVAAFVAEHLGGPFLLLPHPGTDRAYAARAADTDRWLATMRGLRAAHA